MTDATPADPKPPAYDPAPDLQALIEIINELLPTDKLRTRALLADAASRHAGTVLANWPKA